MDNLVRLTVPNYVYKFYKNASDQIADCTPEDIMSDALTAYAGLISREVAKEREQMLSSTLETPADQTHQSR